MPWRFKALGHPERASWAEKWHSPVVTGLQWRGPNRRSWKDWWWAQLTDSRNERRLLRSSSPVANFGYCYQDLFVPAGIEACGDSHWACFLNLHYCQDFSVLFMRTLEPECLGLSPASRTVLGWVPWETGSDWAGSLLGLALRYNTCEGVKEVRLGTRRSWSRFDGSKGFCWCPQELWSRGDPSELPPLEVREPGLFTLCQPVVRCGLPLARALILNQVALQSKSELGVVSHPTFPRGSPSFMRGDLGDTAWPPDP